MGRMGKDGSTFINLMLGIYRRIYAGFIRGKRINSVSIASESWFWRVNAVADDFGNLEGEPFLFAAATLGRRAGQVILYPGMESVTIDPELLKRELLDKKLLKEYEHDGDTYLHVVGFCRIQPGGKNGKRIRRFPASPWDAEEQSGAPLGGIVPKAEDDSEEIPDNPGDRKIIQINPGEPGLHHNHHHTDTENQTETGGGGGNLMAGLGVGELVGAGGEGLPANLQIQSLLSRLKVSPDDQRKIMGRTDISLDYLAKLVHEITRDPEVRNPGRVLLHRLNKTNGKKR